MRFYNNKLPETESSLLLLEQGYKRLREPRSIFIQAAIVLVIAFLSMSASFLFCKYVFGLAPRDTYSLREFVPAHIITAFFAIFLAKLFIRLAFMPKGPFSKNAVYGYRLKSLSLYYYYDGAVSKARKLISHAAPLVLINVFCIFILRFNYLWRGLWLGSMFWRGGPGYYIPFFALYLNSAFCALDIFNFFAVAFCPKKSVFREWGTETYYLASNYSDFFK
jgi:hypothetical protein